MVFELPHVLRNAPGMRAAELLIDGLSVFCFNQSGEKFWEVCFPRQAQHDLKFTIQELDRDGNEVGDPIPHDIDRRVEQITIRLTNGSLEHYQPHHFPNGGPKAARFNRNPAVDDPHDLQWMFDLAGTELRHGNFLGLKPRDRSRPRSVASIRHSLFCNLEPEPTAARISPRSGNHPDASGNFDLGPTNTFIVGVLLGSGSGDIEFEFNPRGLTTIPRLPYDQNKRYRITIINNDIGNRPRIGSFVRGDLRMFYDELINVSGPEKDHWAVPHPERFSPDGDCHGTRFGGATLGP